MAQSTRIQNYKAGQTIVIEGRVGAAFFIVVSGSVEVFKRKDSDEVVLATLRAGEFFGELATMRHVPRSANVRALQDTTCLIIRRADFGILYQAVSGCRRSSGVNSHRPLWRESG